MIPLLSYLLLLMSKYHSKIKQILLDLSVYTLKFLHFFRKVFVGLLVFVTKPFWIILKALLYRPLIKLYGYYILLFKKLRELGIKANARLAFVRRFLVPASLFFLALCVAISNLFINNQTDYSARAYKTVMSNLVKNEFDSAAPEELIVETAITGTSSSTAPSKYLNQTLVLNPSIRINPSVSADYNVGMENDYLFKHGEAVAKPGITLIHGELANPTNNAGETPDRNQVIVYVVKSGDNISSIADHFAISANTILWENNLTERSLIREGDKLRILPFSGVVYTVAKGDTLQKIAQKYKIDAEKIASSNNFSLENPKLVAGQKIFLPGGRRVVAVSPVTSTKRPGNVISVIKDIVKPGDAAPVSGKMNWPTVGYRITQYYSWRHTGLDIGNKVGTPLYAADDGVVEKSGWNNGGYGYMVLINHGGGVKTRYAHASKLYVSAGDEVKKGQVIAAMGSTGRSTGPHIHFEVIVNGKRLNPLNYIR